MDTTMTSMTSEMDFGEDPLQLLLGDLPAGQFLREDLGRRVVRTRSSGDLAPVLSFADLDQILGSRGARYPDIRLVRTDHVFDPSEYTWADQRIDAMRAARLFNEGATIIFSALHFEHPGVQSLCAALSRRLNARFQANVYLTPAGSQGFEPHWDTHDVLLLQVSGAKHWKIFDGGPTLPLADTKFDAKRDKPGPVREEFTLTAGDLVYIPRGVMHAGVAGGEASIHVTLGLLPYTWTDFLAGCLAELSEREAWLRTEVQLDAEQQEAAFERSVRERWAGLAAELAPLTVRDARLEQLMDSQRPVAGDYLRQAMRGSTMNEGAQIRPRPGLLTDMQRLAEGVRVRAGKRSILFASDAHEMHAEATDPHGAVGLLNSVDPSFRGAVAKTLVMEGIATICEIAENSTV